MKIFKLLKSSEGKGELAIILCVIFLAVLMSGGLELQYNSEAPNALLTPTVTPQPSMFRPFHMTSNGTFVEESPSPEVSITTTP